MEKTPTSSGNLAAQILNMIFNKAKMLNSDMSQLSKQPSRGTSLSRSLWKRQESKNSSFLKLFQPATESILCFFSICKS